MGVVMGDLAKRLWDWWKRFAKRVGDVQARLLLSVLYVLLVLPMGFLVRQFSDPLQMKRGRERASGWIPRGAGVASLDEGRRQS